jgi:hypothetical protein
MNRVRVALVPTGAVLLALGVLIGLPVFGVGAAGLSFVVAGGVCLMVAALVASAPSSPSSSSRRRLPPGALLAAPLVLAAGVVASLTLPASADITATGTNTLAQESVMVASSLDQDVTVVSFVEDERARTELMALVARYQGVTSRIGVESRSSRDAADLDVARALGIAEYLALGGPNVVVVADGVDATPVRVRFAAGMPDHEEVLTNALRRATSTTTTKAYVLAGHGEADSRDDSPLGLSRLQGSLAARGVELVPLPLLQVGRIPDDARALVILPGTAALDEAEVALLRSAVDGGLSMVLLLEPDRPSPALASIAAGVGVDVVNDVVVDESPFATMLGGADVASGQTQIAHAITRPLRGALTHFPRAAVLGLSPLDGLTSVPVVSTGAEASSQRTGATGPLPLLVAIEPTTVTGEGSRRRIVVGADASFVENIHIGRGANADLAVNAVLWATAVDDAIAVRPRHKTGALIFLTPSARSRLAFVVVLLVPGGLLAAAVAWAALRRSA